MLEFDTTRLSIEALEVSFRGSLLLCIVVPISSHSLRLIFRKGLLSQWTMGIEGDEVVQDQLFNSVEFIKPITSRFLWKKKIPCNQLGNIWGINTWLLI